MTDAGDSYAAVIVAGGRGRRMADASKPLVTVGGRTILRRVLDAVPGARPRIVVGDIAPADDYLVTAEEPPGSGPAYAAAAGLAEVPDSVPLVAVLAADLPFLDADAISALARALRTGEHDGAVLLDEDGHRQWLCGLWRAEALRGAAQHARPGSGMRHMLGRLAIADVFLDGRVVAPWFDCDTPQALALARRLADEDPDTGS